MRGPSILAAPGALLVLVVTATCSHAPEGPVVEKRRPAGARAEASGDAAREPVYDAGLGRGWEDWGWAPRDLSPGAPARVNMSSYGGWIIASPGKTWTRAALAFRFRAAPEEGDFLEVRLGNDDDAPFPAVKVGPRHRRATPDGWEEVLIPSNELNLTGRAFDRITLRAYKELSGEGWVLFDDVALLPERAPKDGEGAASLEARFSGPTREASVVVDCAATGERISPRIYGIAFNPRKDRHDPWLWELSPSGRRWGGNPASRYNWELGNAWNTASDWFFRNLNYTSDPSYSWHRFLDDNWDHGVETALTIPLLGWVAKDTESYGFPVREHGPQQSHDPYLTDAGDGLSPDGKPLRPGPPARTSVRADAGFQRRWVEAIRARDDELGRRSVHLYLLGNEPMLWSSTHRDVRTEPLGYDELLERTLDYGRAVRRADPAAKIAGPGVWGWPAYFYSAKDAEAGFWKKPDRKAHGDVPLLEWWLTRLKEHEDKTGEKILDHLDVHFYPEGLYNAEVDPPTAARRLRSTRSLWDRSYVEESWIKEPIYLLPRLKDIIARTYPGLGIVIGEYNFGGEQHMSGALALAEALGQFGRHGVYAAYLWTYPARNSPAFWAFRAYRDYDGEGARFPELSLPAVAPERMSAFSSRSDDGKRVVTLVLNQDPDLAAETRLKLAGCASPRKVRAFTLSEATGALVEHEAKKVDGAVRVWLPPYSVTVLEATLE